MRWETKNHAVVRSFLCLLMLLLPLIDRACDTLAEALRRMLGFWPTCSGVPLNAQ